MMKRGLTSESKLDINNVLVFRFIIFLKKKQNKTNKTCLSAWPQRVEWKRDLFSTGTCVTLKHTAYLTYTAPLLIGSRTTIKKTRCLICGQTTALTEDKKRPVFTLSLSKTSSSGCLFSRNSCRFLNTWKTENKSEDTRSFNTEKLEWTVDLRRKKKKRETRFNAKSNFSLLHHVCVSCFVHSAARWLILPALNSNTRCLIGKCSVCVHACVHSHTQEWQCSHKCVITCV